MCRSTICGGRRCSKPLSPEQRARKNARSKERYQEIKNAKAFPSLSDESRLKAEETFTGVDAQGNSWTKTVVRFPGVRKLSHEHQEDAHASLMEESSQWVKSLEPGEVDAIKSYTYGSDAKINDLLLRPEKLAELHEAVEAGFDEDNDDQRRRWQQRHREYEEFKTLTGNIDSALEKSVASEKRNLYRGIDVSRLTGLTENGDFDSYVKDRFSPGKEYQQESYLSTSKSSFIAVDKFTGGRGSQGLLMKIETKKGAGLSRISRFLSEEQEYLLPRNSTFKVVKTERVVVENSVSKKDRQKFGDGYPSEHRLITLVHLTES